MIPIGYAQPLPVWFLPHGNLRDKFRFFHGITPGGIFQRTPGCASRISSSKSKEVPLTPLESVGRKMAMKPAVGSNSTHPMSSKYTSGHRHGCAWQAPGRLWGYQLVPPVHSPPRAVQGFNGSQHQDFGSHNNCNIPLFVQEEPFDRIRQRRFQDDLFIGHIIP